MNALSSRAIRTVNLLRSELEGRFPPCLRICLILIMFSFGCSSPSQQGEPADVPDIGATPDAFPVQNPPEQRQNVDEMPADVPAHIRTHLWKLQEMVRLGQLSEEEYSARKALILQE